MMNSAFKNRKGLKILLLAVCLGQGVEVFAEPNRATTQPVAAYNLAEKVAEWDYPAITNLYAKLDSEGKAAYSNFLAEVVKNKDDEFAKSVMEVIAIGESDSASEILDAIGKQKPELILALEKTGTFKDKYTVVLIDKIKATAENKKATARLKEATARLKKSEETFEASQKALKAVLGE